MDKKYNLPLPIVKKEDKGYKAYFKIFNKKGNKANTNGGYFDLKTQAYDNAIARQQNSINLLKKNIEISNKITIKEALEQYKKELFETKSLITGEKESLSSTEYENINTILNNYLFSYGSILVKSIKDDDFRTWLEKIANTKRKGKKLGGERMNSLRTTFKKFIRFLKDTGYISNDEYDEMKGELFKAEIPEKHFGHRTITNLPTYEDINNLINSFKKEKFEDWFLYAYLLLAFFSSCRISEILALRWENIDFESCFIHIVDSITKRENRENVYKRIKNRNFKTKNKYSIRDIPMMNIYYFVLKDYMQQYKIKFNLEYDSKEFKNAFVFPAYQNIKFKKTKTDAPIYMQYTNTQWLNRQLKRLCKNTENRVDEFDIKLPSVDYFPCRYLRHAGCTHLAKYHGYLETEMVDYMGHSSKDDASMIHQVYEKIDIKDKGYRTRARHPELYIVNPSYELKIKKEKFDAIAELVNTNLRIQVIIGNRSNSIVENINYLYTVKNKREYYYTHDIEWIIEDWKCVYEERSDMKFIEEPIKSIDEIDFSSNIDIDKEFNEYVESK